MEQNRGTGFINLSKFLQANKNNKLGSTVQSGISGMKEGLSKGLATSKAELASGLEGERNRVSSGDTEANQILQSAGQGNLTDQDAEKFKSFTTGGYQGPTGLPNEYKLLSQNKELGQLGGLTRSEGGRKELLKRFVGRPGYSSSQQTLDEMLLGKNQDKLKQARQQALQSLSGIKEESTRGKLQGEEIKTNLNQKQQAIQQNLKSASQQRQQALDTQFKQAQETDQQSKQQYQDLFNKPTIGKILQAYQGKGLDYSPFVNYQDAENLTRSGVASQEQAAQIAALNKLANDPSLNLSENEVGKFKAGSINSNELGLLQDAESRYTSDVSKPLNQHNLGTLPLTDSNKSLSQNIQDLEHRTVQYQNNPGMLQQVQNALNILYGLRGQFATSYGLNAPGGGSLPGSGDTGNLPNPG